MRVPNAEITLHAIEPFRAMDCAGSIAWIYREAYNYPDHEALEFSNGAFAKHVRWPEFALTLAAIAGQPVGFIYGYRSAPGQWWYDTVRPALAATGHASWLDEGYELAEIAVAQAFHSRGIGSALIDAFLRDHAERPLLLSAEMGSAAEALYEKRGFVPLVSDFRYPGFDDRIVIMGRAPTV